MTYAEKIVDALAALNAYYDPKSLAYRLHNPMLLKNYAPDGRHPVNEEGIRIYKSTLSGYKSCVVDIDVKLSGKSITGLRQEQPFRNLLKVIGVRSPESQAFVVQFLRGAISEDISLNTPLKFFAEGKNG